MPVGQLVFKNFREDGMARVGFEVRYGRIADLSRPRLDHLVRGRQQRWRDGDAERVSGLHVNDELGDRVHDKGTVGQSKGASEYSPGDRMNDKRK